MPDFMKTPLKLDGTQVNKDFYRYSRDGITLTKSTSKKVFI